MCTYAYAHSTHNKHMFCPGYLCNASTGPHLLVCLESMIIHWVQAREELHNAAVRLSICVCCSEYRLPIVLLCQTTACWSIAVAGDCGAAATLSAHIPPRFWACPSDPIVHFMNTAGCMQLSFLCGQQLTGAEISPDAVHTTGHPRAAGAAFNLS